MEEKGFFGKLFDFSFSEFVTPSVLHLIYILNILGAAIGALSIIVKGFGSHSGWLGVVSLIVAPCAFILWVIVARIYLELIMVLFRIAENTKKMSSCEKPQPAPASNP